MFRSTTRSSKLLSHFDLNVRVYAPLLRACFMGAGEFALNQNPADYLQRL